MRRSRCRAVREHRRAEAVLRARRKRASPSCSSCTAGAVTGPRSNPSSTTSRDARRHGDRPARVRSERRSRRAATRSPIFADDLAQFCGAVGIERPVVVGPQPRRDDRGRARSAVPVTPSVRSSSSIPGRSIRSRQTRSSSSARFADVARGAGASRTSAALYVQDMGARDEEIGALDRGFYVRVPLAIVAAAVIRGVAARGTAVERSRTLQPCRRPAAPGRNRTRAPTCSGCARSSRISRSGSLSEPAISTRSRCPSRSTR